MHPVSFDFDYGVERHRLTTFFRLLIAIPWIIVGYLYQLAALIVALLAWFALLVTRRYPEGLYDFVAGYVRFSGRLAAWVLLAVDKPPPFHGSADDSYPVQVEVAAPQAEYSHAKTFFKPLLAFPQQVLAYGIGGLLGGAAFIAWWRILFTGRQSVTMNDALRVGLAYTLRMQSFILLLTETHPRLLDLPPKEYPAGAPALPAGAPTPAPVAPIEAGAE
jgi:hypothetical protein